MLLLLEQGDAKVNDSQPRLDPQDRSIFALDATDQSCADCDSKFSILFYGRAKRHTSAAFAKGVCEGVDGLSLLRENLHE
jgi:hypothetical protein